MPQNDGLLIKCSAAAANVVQNTVPQPPPSTSGDVHYAATQDCESETSSNHVTELTKLLNNIVNYMLRIT